MTRSMMAQAITVALGFTTSLATPAFALQEYFNDFQTAVGAELSSNASTLGLDHTPTPSDGSRMFLGRSDGSPILGLSNETVTLELTGLAAHSELKLTFDFYAIQSLDGNNQGGGNDVFTFAVDGGPTLLDTTIAITAFGGTQAFPDNRPAANPPGTGASEPNNSLGYGFFGDNVYPISTTFGHAGSTVKITFTGSGLQDINDESWGIDNLKVQSFCKAEFCQTPIPTVPEPTSLLLLGSGLAGLMAWSQRK